MIGAYLRASSAYSEWRSCPSWRWIRRRRLRARAEAACARADRARAAVGVKRATPLLELFEQASD